MSRAAVSPGARPAGAERRRVGPDRRTELVAVLESVILAEGFVHLTVEDISARLRCSRSTLYAIASSKERLAVVVLKKFYREAAALVEASTAQERDPVTRVETYLATVGQCMLRMSPACYADMTGSEATAEIHRLNARASARRVRELIGEGVSAGVFRNANAEFVAEAAAVLIDRVRHGELLDRTGLSTGDAYMELSALVVNALRPS